MGDPPPNGTTRTYNDNADGTVTETKTGLMWEKLGNLNGIANLSDPHDADNTYTWADAFTVKIAALNTAPCFAGHCDWRLPNITELQSLVDYGRFDPAINPSFNHGTNGVTVSSNYWSSTSLQGGPSLAWGVNFSDGVVFGFDKSNTNFVRAVRGGCVGCP